ncbi:MAG TPA: glycosyltransferase family 2 protein [Pyrinomonadaceae bacterium]|jgi:glycosyltransferase involved in cell wall biosynthesis
MTSATSIPAAAAADERPLVSIGMPVYNEERFLRSALDSLLAQDYENFELIISDNASTDRTAEICADYAARDGRVRYFRNETNIGGIENFNRALQHAGGDFFMWASGHDLWQPSFISRCLEVLLHDETVVLAYPQVMWVDAEGQPMETIHGYLDTRGVVHRLARFSTVMWGLATPFTIYGLIRSSALKRSQPYTNVAAPDVALLGELAMLGAFAHLHEPLFHARRLEDYGSWEMYMQKHFPKMPPRQARKLYWRMYRVLFRAALRHCYGYADVFNTMLVVAHCMFTKNRWMLVGLSTLKESR